jgi:hypothetical protein
MHSLQALGLAATGCAVVLGYGLYADPRDSLEWLLFFAIVTLLVAVTLFSFSAVMRWRRRKSDKKGAWSRVTLVRAASRSYFCHFLAHHSLWIGLGLIGAGALVTSFGLVSLTLALAMMLLAGVSYGLFALIGVRYHHLLVLCALIDPPLVRWPTWTYTDEAYWLNQRFRRCKWHDSNKARETTGAPLLADLSANLELHDERSLAHFPNLNANPGERLGPEIFQRASGFAMVAAYAAPIILLVVLLDFPGSRSLNPYLAELIPPLPFSIAITQSPESQIDKDDEALQNQSDKTNDDKEDDSVGPDDPQTNSPSPRVGDEGAEPGGDTTKPVGADGGDSGQDGKSDQAETGGDPETGGDTTKPVGADRKSVV